MSKFYHTFLSAGKTTVVNIENEMKDVLNLSYQPCLSTE